MEKDLIIGAFTNYTDYDVLKPWVQSIKDSGFEGDTVLIAIGTTDEMASRLESEGVKVVRVAKNDQMMVHMLRFIYIYNFLKEYGDEYRYVISTDVRDVIFQKNPTEYLKKKLMPYAVYSLLVSSESISIENEEWNRDNIIKNFGHYFYLEVNEADVCNVGILAGRSKAIQALCFDLFHYSSNRPDWVADQAAYNILVNSKKWESIILQTRLKDAWALNAHVTNKPDLIEKLGPYLLEERPYFKDGQILNAAGDPFVIVHQYDRVPEWMEYFSDKYGINITKDTNTGTSPKYTLSKQ